MNTGKRPDWNLCTRSKSPDDTWEQIGAGWVNEKGNISITLNEGVVLRRDPSKMLYLFPNRERKGGGRAYFKQGRERMEQRIQERKEQDYMERKRQERQKPTQPPHAQPVDPDPPCDDPVEPDWL